MSSIRVSTIAISLAIGVLIVGLRAVPVPDTPTVRQVYVERELNKRLLALSEYAKAHPHFKMTLCSYPMPKALPSR